jgi:hypothetical protein
MIRRRIPCTARRGSVDNSTHSFLTKQECGCAVAPSNMTTTQPTDTVDDEVCCSVSERLESAVVCEHQPLQPPVDEGVSVLAIDRRRPGFDSDFGHRN